MTPQTILILLCAAEAVLLLIRLSIGGSGRRLRSPDVGSSMTIGGREVQEDFVGTLATQTGLVAVLADGMGKAYGARIDLWTPRPLFHRLQDWHRPQDL